ncbi:MAG: iron-containing alcohol dehydrogenase [Deltaproteobacteria bacterium]|nr:iron-containing alcohol dehydrogenase [Deltaproteobacteria bacterium]
MNFVRTLANVPRVLDRFFQVHVPTRIVYGPGLIDDFAAEWELLGVRRAFCIADAGVAQAGLLDRVRAGLQRAGAECVGVFTQVPPNSTLRAVEACAVEAKGTGAEALVAVGGGSVIDTAKCAGLLVAHGGDLVADYAGAQTVPGPILPVVAVPTTAGTGSEVSQAAMVADPDTRRKLSFVDHHLRPRLAILDPSLTIGLPPLLTATTGMDAVTHAIEAFTGIEHAPFADAAATEALRLIAAALPAAARNGADMAARGAMLVAATLAGVAFDHSMVGVVHAMAHAVGALADVHHGAANAILLPYGMRYNHTACRDRYAELAVRLGLARGPRRGAGALGAWVASLRRELHERTGLPLTLREAGVREDQLPDIAALAEEDGASFYNPRPVEAKRVLPLLHAAWRGAEE